MPNRYQAGPEQALRLRTELADFAARAACGELPLRLVSPVGALVAGGSGHFHLGAELFLQIGGHTRFTFAHGTLRLDAGQALLIPAKVLHDEQVGAEGTQPFGNIVAYADGGMLTCHLAHEVQPGQPDILHLEGRRHPQADLVQGWLAEAARLGPVEPGTPAVSIPTAEQPSSQPWVMAQVRALLGAALAGMLRALHDPADTPGRPSEPALLARARVLIQNQLGDHQLSVARLAAQCDCSADHLSSLFRRHVGEALNSHITRLRMERAARLLLESELAGKEIAWACGYAGASYFIHAFRQHHGCTPQVWRARQPTVSG